MNVLKKTLVEFVIVIVVCALLVVGVNFFMQGEVDEDVDDGSVDITQNLDADEYVKARINDVYIDLEIAADDTSKALGLMHREELDWDRGMIFVYEEETVMSFWMQNVLIPLDMIFVNEGNEIVGIIEDVPICEQSPCPTYSIEDKAKYVVEVNAGWIEENAVEIGDRVDFIVEDLSVS